jgi:cytochrome oxidase Cu insertion factor (SCO1/SenC/PrrC family)
MPLPADYEPAERDPKKLRKTAWILVAIGAIGGVLILKAYEKANVEKSSDNKPAYTHCIQKERDLRIIRQDGKTVDLFELRGNVWVVGVIALQNPAAAARSHAVMKRLAEKHSANPDFNLVSLAVEPIPAQDAVTTLTKAADMLGIKPPQWWLGTNEPATLHKFIKNELKANIFPHQEGGLWVFDSSIVLIDKNGHIRRAVVPQKQGGPPYIATFDFDQAAKWDEEKKLTGTARNNQQELELLLQKTIDSLLAEPFKN